MPRVTQRQTKTDKAKYDKERKAKERKERRFTKPLKLFFKAKYFAQYDEFEKFFKQLENTYPGKKDLTKTSMFREFLSNYPVEENSTVSLDAKITAELFPNVASILESVTSSDEAISQASTAFPNTSSSKAIVEASSTSPVQVLESSSHNQTRNIISELVDELFGPGGLDQYIDHVENMDEGIDVNILDELKLDLEPFDFELEAIDF